MAGSDAFVTVPHSIPLYQWPSCGHGGASGALGGETLHGGAEGFGLQAGEWSLLRAQPSLQGWVIFGSVIWMQEFNATLVPLEESAVCCSILLCVRHFSGERILMCIYWFFSHQNYSFFFYHCPSLLFFSIFYFLLI